MLTQTFKHSSKWLTHFQNCINKISNFQQISHHLISFRRYLPMLSSLPATVLLLLYYVTLNLSMSWHCLSLYLFSTLNQANTSALKTTLCNPVITTTTLSQICHWYIILLTITLTLNSCLRNMMCWCMNIQMVVVLPSICCKWWNILLNLWKSIAEEIAIIKKIGWKDYLNI